LMSISLFLQEITQKLFLKDTPNRRMSPPFDRYEQLEMPSICIVNPLSGAFEWKSSLFAQKQGLKYHTIMAVCLIKME